MKKFNYTHDDNEVVPSYVGKFNLEDIGEVDVITISNDDGKIPHFYIFNNNFELGLCIYDNKYYGKNNIKLSSNQKKQLNDYLHTKYNSFIFGESDYTIWQHLAYNYNNTNDEYDANISDQPNYEYMEEFIDE